MLRRFLQAAIVTFACAASLAIATPGQADFAYDHQGALDQALVYAKQMAQTLARNSGVKLDLDSPRVVARTFKGNRHLVLVTYGSDREEVSFGVTLEQRHGSASLAFVHWSYMRGCANTELAAFEDATSDTPYVGSSGCDA